MIFQYLKHEKANVNPLVQGVHIIELAKKVYRLCRAQQLTKKGKLLRILLSHCTFDGEKLYPTHNGLFDLLVKSKENDDWLPSLDDFRNFCLTSELNTLLQDYGLVRA